MAPARSSLLAILGAAGVALAAPGAAHASTVTYSSVNVLSYAAAAGELNKLTITISANRVVFTEDGGVLITEAEADCDGNGTPVVSCKIDHNPMAPVFAVNATLADMDDRATASLPADSTIAGNFSGQSGADELDAASAFNSSLDGGTGADRLTGGRGSNRISGGPDNDIAIGGPAGSSSEYSMGPPGPDGADEIKGGPGLDTVSYEGRTAAITADADGMPDDGEAGEGDNIDPSVEGIQGGSTDDLLTASSAVDGSLSGYGGNDHLVGGPGDDTFLGGDGDDLMEGGAGDDTAATNDRGSLLIGGAQTADVGADTFLGGDGIDTQDYSGRGASVSVSLNGAADDGEAGEGDNIGADVERFLGGRGDDTLAGDGDAEFLIGGSGNDTLSPGGGGDFVAAEGGDDNIAAQDGTLDRVACGVGTDTVTADFVDQLDACEAATVAPAPEPPDTTKPAIQFTSLQTKPKFKALARGLSFKLGADEPASFVVVLEGTAKRATLARAYNLTLATKSLKLGAGKRVVKLKPKRSLLGKRRKLKLRLRVTAKDAAGNTQVATRTIRVRR